MYFYWKYTLNGSLDCGVYVCLLLVDTEKYFSKVALSSLQSYQYVWDFWLFHIFVNIYYCRYLSFKQC